LGHCRKAIKRGRTNTRELNTDPQDTKGIKYSTHGLPVHQGRNTNGQDTHKEDVVHGKDELICLIEFTSHSSGPVCEEAPYQDQTSLEDELDDEKGV
jgi:hypothetical protein